MYSETPLSPSLPPSFPPLPSHPHPFLPGVVALVRIHPSITHLGLASDNAIMKQGRRWWQRVPFRFLPSFPSFIRPRLEYTTRPKDDCDSCVESSYVRLSWGDFIIQSSNLLAGLSLDTHLSPNNDSSVLVM